MGSKGPPVSSLTLRLGKLPNGFFFMSSGVGTQFPLFARRSLYCLGYLPGPRNFYTFHSPPSEITIDTFVMAPPFLLQHIDSVGSGVAFPHSDHPVVAQNVSDFSAFQV